MRKWLGAAVIVTGGVLSLLEPAAAAERSRPVTSVSSPEVKRASPPKRARRPTGVRTGVIGCTPMIFSSGF